MSKRSHSEAEQKGKCYLTCDRLSDGVAREFQRLQHIVDDGFGFDALSFSFKTHDQAVAQCGKSDGFDVFASDMESATQ